MRTLNTTVDATDDIQGVTLEERTRPNTPLGTSLTATSSLDDAHLIIGS